MYTKYYGLTKKPFALTPDPQAVFMSETHQEGLAILKYGILTNKSYIIVIVSPVYKSLNKVEPTLIRFEPQAIANSKSLLIPIEQYLAPNGTSWS